MLFRIFCCNSTSGNVVCYKSWCCSLALPLLTTLYYWSLPLFSCLHSRFLYTSSPGHLPFTIFTVGIHSARVLPSNCKISPHATTDLASMLWLIHPSTCGCEDCIYIYKLYIYISRSSVTRIVWFILPTRLLAPLIHQHPWIMLRSSFHGSQASRPYIPGFFFPLLSPSISIPITVHGPFVV